MRVLLIAYDYPPTQSPRALRWRYLSRELALLGHEVHVLTPDLGEPGITLPRSPGRVVLHHTFPGPFGWLVGNAKRKRAGSPAEEQVSPSAPVAAARLNWRGRVVDGCKRLASRVLFPDVRAEWNPWARRALNRILAEVGPDVVVTSHEPASTLPLGMHAQQQGYAWIADLGDPVCAAYTPGHWRRRAMDLEARVAARADRILVTNEATRLLLLERHSQDPQRHAVLPNGYDDRRVREAQQAVDMPSFDTERLELIYAGRLYGYRDPTPLLQAVAATAGVRLTLVVPDPPEGDAGKGMMKAAGDRLRVLGPLPHAAVQAMLERADVLVNFGDTGQPVRIAAKVYEYLGVDRPILHVHTGEGDAAADLLRALGRGWFCGGDANELAACLTDLRQRKRAGRLREGLDLKPLEDYAHSTLGARLGAHLEEARRAREPAEQQSYAGVTHVSQGHSKNMEHRGDAGMDRVRPEAPLSLELHGRPPAYMEQASAARHAQLRQLKAEARQRESQISILTQRLEWMDAQLTELRASNSWRLTAPLRALATAARSVKTTIRDGRRNRARSRAAGASVVQATILEGEDTFIFYRIIGNDLPPRHKHGQVIENLRFILEHEPALRGCEKRFVLNRLRSLDQEREIMRLLGRHGFGYTRIPFVPEEYGRTAFDVDILPEPGFLAGEQVGLLDQAEQDRLFSAIYRHKNNYAMNNNGARNAALRDGRERAKWILPWDGNCFLTLEAWEQIRAGIAKEPANRYFVVPMARMLDNGPLIRGGAIPKATEEPQIIFRADAGEQFNPAFCYGRRPKVELLWRLGVEGPWDSYIDDAWDQARRGLSPEAGLVGKAGWVARLFSGMGTLEAGSGHSTFQRGIVRSGAIIATLQDLDARTAGVDPADPVSIHMRTLRKEARCLETPPLGDVVEALRQAAEEAWRQWKTGAANRTLEQTLADPVVLALGREVGGEARYATVGADIINHAFVEPRTRMDPGLVSRMPGLYFLLDAMRMFENAGVVTIPMGAGFRAWLRARLEWLLNSPEGLRERRAKGHAGTWHDLQVAGIAGFLDEHATVYETLIRAQARIGEQFAADGRQPASLKETDTAHACCFNFQGWVHLAELAERWGVDLWGHKPQRGGSLGEGGRWLLSQEGKPWPYGPAGDFDVDRYQPIHFAVAGREGDLADHSPYEFKERFPSWTGIRPFWTLGSYSQPTEVAAGAG